MYYVYVLIDPFTNKIFYVGKGSGKRVNSHEKFKSGCNNIHKDLVIKKILESHELVPYKILKEFNNEDDAYDYEEKIIQEIGIKNLTNIESSRRPPSQLGNKRSLETIKMITANTKKQGKARTIEHVKENAEVFYNILLSINNSVTRANAVKDLNVTVDLFNKVKRKYNMYVEILNENTDYYVEPKKVKKINGMQAKVFYENKEVLLEMYKMVKLGKKRRTIATELGISLDFYDRMLKKENDFNAYIGVN
jgi:hypothetical protein